MYFTASAKFFSDFSPAFHPRGWRLKIRAVWRPYFCRLAMQVIIKAKGIKSKFSESRNRSWITS